MGAVGGGAFVVASLVLGIRLLLLARRTREVPEFAMGLGLLSMGALSYPINVAARLAVTLSDEARVGVMVLSQILMVTGCVGIGVFNWRVFRPNSRWPLWLITAMVLGVLVLFTIQSLSDGFFAFVAENRGAYRFCISVQGIVYIWAFAESFRYYRLLRKRAELGLSDPVVTNRVGLWALTTLAAMIINQSMVALEILGINSATSPVTGIIVAPLGMVCAVGLGLAFFPPAAYTRRILSSARRNA